MTERTTHPGTTNAWKTFWNRGGWWKTLLLAAVYLLIYELLGLLIVMVFGHLIDRKNLFANPQSVFFGIAFPVLLGGILLIVFVRSLGWFSELFGRQSVRGSAWMWIAVPLLIIPVVLRLAGTDWSKYSLGVVITTLFLGVCVGFAEELLTRGLAVNLLRKGGYGERTVMVLSSAIFALLHSVNRLGGQNPIVTITTVAYAFGFGIMMYLVLRVTGHLIWPMILHAVTDPTTMLVTGAIDAHSQTEGSTELISAAGLFNILYIVLGIILIFVVRGRHSQHKHELS